MDKGESKIWMEDKRNVKDENWRIFERSIDFSLISIGKSCCDYFYSWVWKRKKKCQTRRLKLIEIRWFSKLEEFIKLVYGKIANLILAESSYVWPSLGRSRNTKENFQSRGKEAGNGNASVSGLGLATMPFIT